MKKIRKGIFLLALMLLCCANFSIAFADAIHSIDIMVEIQHDGSAKITQTWDTTSDSGTEFYIPMTNMGDMEIHDYKVTDGDGRAFTFVDSWNVNGSLEQKAQKNGLNWTSDGVEICWGKGAYGRQTYILEYTMTNLVKSYPDYDGFISRFVNDQMNPVPENATVKITFVENSKELLDTEDFGIWAFGYEGLIYKEDGFIIAEPEEPLGYNNHMTILVRIPKGWLEPVSIGSGSFEQVIERAMQGSDYNDPNRDELYAKSNGIPEDGGDMYFPPMGIFGILMMLMFGAFPLLLFVGAIALIIFLIKKSSGGEFKNQYIQMGGDPQKVEYYRKAPCNGSIPATSFALAQGRQVVAQKDTISAYVLYLVRAKALRPYQELGSFGKESTAFRIDPSVNINEPYAKSLLLMIQEASGADNVLQEKELKRWARKNYQRFESWLESVDASGKNQFQNLGGLDVDFSKGRARFVLTDLGVNYIDQALGFKKFLNDFTLIAERETKEVELWDEYLIFAALFGIADKVAKEMKAIQPNFVQESEFFDDDVDFVTMLYMSNTIHHAITSGYQSGASLSGSGGGGSSSIGGGGGFSGGGSGGGSR